MVPATALEACSWILVTTLALDLLAETPSGMQICHTNTFAAVVIPLNYLAQWPASFNETIRLGVARTGSYRMYM